MDIEIKKEENDMDIEIKKEEKDKRAALLNMISVGLITGETKIRAGQYRVTLVKLDAKVKPRSRVTRWSDACAAAKAGLEELNDIKQEYQDWFDNLGENLRRAPVGEKLEAVCNIDIDSAISAVDDAEGADLPMGWGND